MRFPGAFLLIVAPQQEHDCVRPLGACGRGRGRGGLGMWWNGEGGGVQRDHAGEPGEELAREC